MANERRSEGRKFFSGDLTFDTAAAGIKRHLIDRNLVREAGMDANMWKEGGKEGSRLLLIYNSGPLHFGSLTSLQQPPSMIPPNN